jgi:hypothetical protein
MISLRSYILNVLQGRPYFRRPLRYGGNESEESCMEGNEVYWFVW